MVKLRYAIAMFPAAWLAVAGAVLAQDAETVDLRPTWRQGQTSRYHVSTQRLTTVEVRGMDASRTTTTNVEGAVTWEVLSADPKGGGSARMTITDMSMNVSNGNGDSYTVTASKAPEHLQSVRKMLSALVGKPLTVQVNPDGSIGTISGWKQIQSEAGDAGKDLSERDFQESASDLATLIGGPAEAATGDTWKHRFDWDHEMGELHLQSTYKLLGVEATADIPVAMIERNSDISCTIDTSKLPTGGTARVSMKLTQGEQASQLMFDLSRHECVGRNVDRLLVFEMSIAGAGRSLTQVITQRTNSQALRIAEE